MRTIKPIVNVGVYEWENQARQYPVNGNGTLYFKGIRNISQWVDCLLYYGDDSMLQGILNYYPFNFPPSQRKGSANLEVRSDKRRQRIAIALLNEGMLEYHINLNNNSIHLKAKSLLRIFLNVEKLTVWIKTMAVTLQKINRQG
jgi:hypothetical protein